MANFKLSILLLRHDLRLDDNTALIAALRQSEQVMVVYIFEEHRTGFPINGPNSFGFLVNSLVELNIELHKYGSQIFFFKGITNEIVEQILNETRADAVFVNRDYTPFVRELDEQTGKLCRGRGVGFFSFADALLCEPEQVRKNDGTPYSVFSPFLKRARMLTIKPPVIADLNNYFVTPIRMSSSVESPIQLLESSNPNLLLKGGRTEAMHLLQQIENLNSYDEERNIPAKKGTSLLSAHHRYGTISIRETYHKIVDLFSKEHSLIGELFWRDFFTHIAFHYPHVHKNSFQQKYDSIVWTNDEKMFERWCSGETGFPIVDAGMRELNATGYMHNRVRMIVASFLVKDLHIDWRWGEHYFAERLLDYDPAVNNGNWQWAASTGCDAQPYFRIFNPWSQQQRFDNNCIYIKKWIPELASLGSNEIHKLVASQKQTIGYPLPVVDHAVESKVAVDLFRNCSKK